MEGVVENADGREQILKKSWFYTTVQGVIASAIGLVLILFPTIGMVFVSLVFSFFLIWLGISQVVLGYKLSSVQKQWWLILLRGVVMLICGIVVLSFPISFAKIGTGVPLVLTGLFLMFFGIHDLVSKRVAGSGLHHSLSSILLIATGALLCFAPVASALIIFRILGITTLASGILSISRGLINRRWYKTHLSESEETTEP